MDQLSYHRHRFPPPIIQQAIWLYLRFTLSYRDVEELLAERGLEVTYETARRWDLKFGPGFARRLRRSRPRPSDRWHHRRDGRSHRGQADVPVARRRSRGRGYRHAGSAPARQARGTPADAQAGPKTGLCAEIADDRQTWLLRSCIPASSADLRS